ncbi:Uncharacterised protein [Vibrio harveyi]|nr:Uncharacterised protein [Vibrio harveyi]
MIYLHAQAKCLRSLIKRVTVERTNRIKRTSKDVVIFYEAYAPVWKGELWVKPFLCSRKVSQQSID